MEAIAEPSLVWKSTETGSGLMPDSVTVKMAVLSVPSTTLTSSIERVKAGSSLEIVPSPDPSAIEALTGVERSTV